MASIGCGQTRTRHAAAAHNVAMRSLLHRLSGERGDVPGWVLITLMTAGLVMLIWGLAGPALSDVFSSAISKVTGP